MITIIHSVDVFHFKHSVSSVYSVLEEIALVLVGVDMIKRFMNQHI